MPIATLSPEAQPAGRSLRINIVGAGIAGLSSAISLRRAGHVVHLYERSSMNNEVGAAINVPPNATRFLLAWGLDPKKERFVRAGPVNFMNPFTMDINASFSHIDSEKHYGGAALWYAHRVDLHEGLKKLATGEGPGVPATIHLNSYVVGYNPNTPSITLADGEIITSDLVVGADGLHSIACETVLGRKNHPIAPSHYNCCYRFLIPAATLEEDPETRFWNKDAEGMIRLFPHNDTNRRLVSYPCRDDTVHNFVGIFFDEAMKSATREDYLAMADKEKVLETFGDFHPSLRAVISKATEIKRWPLLYRPPVPTWRKGKMVLAGDAAHPMLPHQGQGGAQGLEDGVVLGIVLHGASTPEDIEARLAIYEKVRRNRASAIQILSNVGQDQSHLVRNELLEFLPEADIPNNPQEIFKFNFGHDCVAAAVEAMRQHDPSFELPAGFFVGKEAASSASKPTEVPEPAKQTADEPAADMPAVEESVVDQPVVDEPIADPVSAPAVDATAVETPATETPTVEAATASEQPAPETIRVAEAAAEAPIIVVAAAEQPAVEAPVSDTPATATEAPVAEVPTIESEIVKQPVVKVAVVVQPAVEEVLSEKMIVQEPATNEAVCAA